MVFSFRERYIIVFYFCFLFSRTFSEGGNYGNEEASDFIKTLNDLRGRISRERKKIMHQLEKNNYKSIIDVKNYLFKIIKP